MQLFRSKSAFCHFFDFCAQKSLFAKKLLFSEKVTFELPGLEKVAIFHWFLKGPERSAPSATFDDTKTIFAEKSVKFS